MNCGNPSAIHLARLVKQPLRTQRRANAAFQLRRRFVRKRNGQNLVDIINATRWVRQRMRDAFRERERLTRSGSRRDIHGAHKAHNAFFLFRRVSHGYIPFI